nr:DUF2125 domain-containing protein [Siccirubricoccus sp. G192]
MQATPPPRRGGAAGARAGRLALRGLLGAALLLALLAAGHALLWRWMGSQLQDGFTAWAETRRAQGWRVEHAPPLRGGWPFAATLTLPRFHLEGGGATLPGGMDWQAEALVLRLSPPRLDRLAVEMPGRHRLRLGEMLLPFTADRLVATLPIERNVLPREARMEAERLRLGTVTGAVEIRAAELEIETRITAIEGGARGDAAPRCRGGGIATRPRGRPGGPHPRPPAAKPGAGPGADRPGAARARPHPQGEGLARWRRHTGIAQAGPALGPGGRHRNGNAHAG